GALLEVRRGDDLEVNIQGHPLLLKFAVVALENQIEEIDPVAAEDIVGDCDLVLVAGLVTGIELADGIIAALVAAQGLDGRVDRLDLVLDAEAIADLVAEFGVRRGRVLARHQDGADAFGTEGSSSERNAHGGINSAADADDHAAPMEFASDLV